LGSKKPTYFFDATPIIHFARIGKLRLILDICEPYITREVYNETVEREETKPDALVVRDAIERSEIRIYDVHDRNLVKVFQRHPEIHGRG